MRNVTGCGTGHYRATQFLLNDRSPWTYCFHIHFFDAFPVPCYTASVAVEHWQS